MQAILCRSLLRFTRYDQTATVVTLAAARLIIRVLAVLLNQARIAALLE